MKKEQNIYYEMLKIVDYQISVMFNIKPAAIYKIVHRITWKNI